MQHAFRLAPLLLALAGCVHTVSCPLFPVVVVHVVDADGNAVSGAEILVQRRVFDAAALNDLLLLGNVGRLERFGTSFPADAQGAAHIEFPTEGEFFVARTAGLFGIAQVTAKTMDELTITLERDETITIVCADAEGRPAPGALVWIGANPRAGTARVPGLVEVTPVLAADGKLEAQHAQYWRALQSQGHDIRIAAFVLWGTELDQDGSIPFPAAGSEPTRFEVSSSGTITVRTEDGTKAASMLRWLNPPLDPDDPDDVPEFPILSDDSVSLAVPLGCRFEVIAQIEGRVDPRVAFDGPKSPGERVHVVLPATSKSAQVTGRLVDENGASLGAARFDAWMECEGQRVEPEQESLTADQGGGFAFEFPPGSGGTLHIELDRTPERLGTYEFTPSSRSALVVVDRLAAGTNDVGNVVCAYGK